MGDPVCILLSNLGSLLINLLSVRANFTVCQYLLKENKVIFTFKSRRVFMLFISQNLKQTSVLMSESPDKRNRSHSVYIKKECLPVKNIFQKVKCDASMHTDKALQVIYQMSFTRIRNKQYDKSVVTKGKIRHKTLTYLSWY